MISKENYVILVTEQGGDKYGHFRVKINIQKADHLPIKVLRYIGLTPGDRVIFKEKNGHIELAASSKFSIDDLSAKYRNVSSKKATDEQITKARQEAWAQRGQAK